MELFDTVAALTRPDGPSGFESSAAEAAAELLRSLCDEVKIDYMGNAIGLRRCGTPGAKKVLLDAHLDQVGMIVTGYDGAFLRFAQLGGIDPRVLVNQPVTLMTQPPRQGLITAKLSEDSDAASALSDLRIDLGAGEKDLSALVPIGTPMVYDQPLFRLGEHFMAGRSLDDRCCFALLLRTLELVRDKTLDVDLYVLGSVGEETDSRGAITAAHRIAPDCAVAVDVTFGKSPDCTETGCFSLGKGPVVGVGPNIAHWMLRRFQRLSESEQIPIGLEVMAGSTGTNGWDIQIQHWGIATAILSVPLRYMHTPVEVIYEKDLEDCARLLAAFVTGIGEEAGLCGSF